jgi:hypothetical protein
MFSVDLPFSLSSYAFLYGTFYHITASFKSYIKGGKKKKKKKKREPQFPWQPILHVEKRDLHNDRSGLMKSAPPRIPSSLQSPCLKGFKGSE